MRKRYGAAALALVLLLSLAAGLAQAATITLGANTYTMVTTPTSPSISVTVNGATADYSADKLPVLVPSYEKATFSAICIVAVDNDPEPKFQMSITVQCTPGKVSLSKLEFKILKPIAIENFKNEISKVIAAIMTADETGIRLHNDSDVWLLRVGTPGDDTPYQEPIPQYGRAHIIKCRDFVNLRAAPGTDQAIIGQAPLGAAVALHGVWRMVGNHGWSYVGYGDLEGWVRDDFLRVVN